MESNRPDGVSCVILAAGENRRLNGIIAPHQKPLMLLNGKTLIAHAVEHSRRWRANEVTVIVSPHNAAQIAHVVKAVMSPRDAMYVMQPEPNGIVEAISLGFRAARYDKMLILCADNQFQLEDNTRIMPETPVVFGMRAMSGDDSARFTKYNPIRGFYSGEGMSEAELCWIGPLLLYTSDVELAVNATNSIVPFLNVATKGRKVTPFRMMCSDLGIPEEWA